MDRNMIDDERVKAGVTKPSPGSDQAHPVRSVVNIAKLVGSQKDRTPVSQNLSPLKFPPA